MGLQQNIQKDPVSRLALREPVTISSSETLRTAIERMREAKLGCAIAVGDDHKPLGVLTESKLTQLLAEHGSQVVDETVASHMTEPCPCVQLTDPIACVLEAMQLKNTRFMCVVDSEGRLVGLTGQKGLIEFVADHFPGQVMVQRVGGNPYPAEREGA
ncbi:MAG: CBS domain-containing protein [Planctomycetaceae bacterium]|nr:CBS domain-containing protein [Planctomycetales bacterium]MCB9921666.1 CBS domain-containing protein [Planctomycetaceae bacterium]